MPGREINANKEKVQPAVVLQNRDRSGAASIAQMQAIASAPDYLLAGPSREMTTGAPVVFGDLPSTALTGREESVVDGKRERIKARYAVVDANDLIASNRADGTTVEDYANGAPGKLRAVAGNGRTAGLQHAYQQGTAGQYQQELIADAAALGIDPSAIAAMKRPTLVRVMDASDVKADMGDRTNITNTQKLSPVEQAANDARRFDVANLSFDEQGMPTAESVRGFVRSMPVSEHGDMLNADGTPTRQAIDRLMAATFKQAYQSDELVQLYAQATDQDARAVMTAAADAGGVMAALSGKGAFDVRSAVADAAKMAVNAARQGLKLSDVIQNADFDMNPEAWPVAKFLADNIRSPKKMAEGLRRWGQLALEQAQIEESNKAQGGLFGAKPTLTREEIFSRLGDDANPIGQAIAAKVTPPVEAPAPTPELTLNAANKPFSSEGTAKLALRKFGHGEVVPIAGGFAIKLQGTVGAMVNGVAGPGFNASSVMKPVAHDMGTEVGTFGPILTQYRGDAQGAIKALTKLQDGEAVAALHHPEIGDIDLVWGKLGDPSKDFAGGYGLAKLYGNHPEVVSDLQEILSSLKVKSKTENRIILESKDHKSAISLNWAGKEKTWLLSAYEKKIKGTDGTTIYTTEAERKGGSLSIAPSASLTEHPDDFGKFAEKNDSDHSQKHTGGAVDKVSGFSEPSEKNDSTARIQGNKGSQPQSNAAQAVNAAAHEAATSPNNNLPEPTQAQKDAGNYRKGHIWINGHHIAIENPAGSKRSPEWPPLQNHYGYIKGTVGKDKDHVDVFMTDRANDASLPVFVVDQNNTDGSFDEHKVVMGAATEQEARSTYLGNYSKDWNGLGDITQMTQDEFKDWVRNPSKTKRRAAKESSTTQAGSATVANGQAAPAIDTSPTAPWRKSWGKAAEVATSLGLPTKDGKRNLKLPELAAAIEAKIAEPKAGESHTTPEIGPFGPILTQFKGNAQGAIKALTELQTGEAVAALNHPDVGDIDLVWGKAPEGKNEGLGLAKLTVKHPEVLGDLQGFLDRLHKDDERSGPNRVRLTDASGEAVVSLNWKGDKRSWLLTAYEREAGAGTSMDIASNELKDDTARLEPSPSVSLPPDAANGNTTNSTIERYAISEGLGYTERNRALFEQPSLPPALSTKLQEAHKAYGYGVKPGVIISAIATEKKDLTGTPKTKRERAERIARLEHDLSLFADIAARRQAEVAAKPATPKTPATDWETYNELQNEGGDGYNPHARRNTREQTTAKPANLKEGIAKVNTEKKAQATASTAPSAINSIAFPVFENYSDALTYVSQRAKELGMKEIAYRSTDEYKAFFPQIQALYEAAKSESNKTKEENDAAKVRMLAEAGLAVGDRVKTAFRGMFMSEDARTGTVVMRSGAPYVQMDSQITVSKNGRLSETSRLPWDKGWTKESSTTPTATATETVAIQKPSTYLRGDKAEYTGKTETKHGALWYEVKFVEGRKTGTTAVTSTAPNGSNKLHEDRKKADGKRPRIVTPQDPGGNYDRFIKIAADSIGQLRKIDAERVLNETPEQFRNWIAGYIKQNRSDLVEEVDAVMLSYKNKPASIPKTPPKLTLDELGDMFDEVLGELVAESKTKQENAPAPVVRPGFTKIAEHQRKKAKEKETEGDEAAAKKLKALEEQLKAEGQQPITPVTAIDENGEMQGEETQDPGDDIAYARTPPAPSANIMRGMSAIRPAPKQATVASVRAAVAQLVNGIGVLPNQLGNVVVATAAEIQRDWMPIIGSNQLIESAGDGRAQGFYHQKTNTIFLIADRIKPGDELGVAAHELMHKHGEAILGKEGWNRLHSVISSWANAPANSAERMVYEEASRRVKASGAHLSTQELFPYAVQVALEYGIRPNMAAEQGSVARWLASVRNALRVVWTKVTSQPESFKTQDLVNLAFGIAQRENPAYAGGLDGAGHEKTKGREWLENSVASNLPQPQVIAALDQVSPDAQFSRRSASGNNLPNAIIAHQLGDLKKHPDYERAKSGDFDSALRLAIDMVDDAMVQKVLQRAAGADLIVPVVSIEASGRNKIPQAVAEVLAAKIGLVVETKIIQANTPKRTSMDGLSRLLNPPVFEGNVQPNAAYLLIDDTLTQGGTFAAMASHIRDNGGHVAGVLALTGKQYSAKLAPSSELLEKVRERYQSVEDQFRAATGYGFDALTESEARYLAQPNNAQSVRDRIIEAGSQASKRLLQSKTEGNEDGEILFSRSIDDVKAADLRADALRSIAANGSGIEKILYGLGQINSENHLVKALAEQWSTDNAPLIAEFKKRYGASFLEEFAKTGNFKNAFDSAVENGISAKGLEQLASEGRCCTKAC